MRPRAAGVRTLARTTCLAAALAAGLALVLPSRAEVSPPEDVSLSLPDGAGQLAGTLAHVPHADTLVVLISGSGPTDRDGNQPQLKNDSMRQVSDGLAALGVATLRFDKRGSGRSVVRGFREEDVQLQTYAGDVEACGRVVPSALHRAAGPAFPGG